LNFTPPEIAAAFYLASSPVLILGIAALIALMQGVFPKIGSVRACQTLLNVALAAAIAVTVTIVKSNANSYLGGSYSIESISLLGQTLILALALITSFLFGATHLKRAFFRGEITSLFLMIVLGMLVLVSANELISLFIGLELASIGLYALVGYIKPSRKSLEGAVKYFVLGSFATGFLLFGFALLYAATGSMVISEIVAFLPNAPGHPWVKLGALLTMVGLGFKFALAPFHLWAPDAYEAAPTGITGFMATSVKIMVVVVMLRFVAQGMPHLQGTWDAFFMFTAILSTIFGNLLALVQSSIKRMLAYSSVAHAGYMAIAVCAIGANANALPIAAMLFYLVAYAIISVGAFGVLMWLETAEHENLQIDDLAGLAKSHPWASFALAVFMFSFAGIPPTAGFMGKFFIFSSALNQGLYAVVLIGILGSVISLYYYLRVIVKMYMADRLPASAVTAPRRSWVVLGVTAASVGLTLYLGTIGPTKALKSMQKASKVLLSH